MRSSDMMFAQATEAPATTHQFAATPTDAARVATFAIAFGVFMIFLAGFAQTDALHNGAHDTRHALSFPCH